VQERLVHPRVPLPPDDRPAEVAEPGEPPLDRPPPLVPPELPPVLVRPADGRGPVRDDRVDPAGREPVPEPVAVGDSRSITARAGRPVSLSSVGSTSFVADVAAGATVTASGVLRADATATTFVPLPRLVLPTAPPPFSPARTTRRRTPPPTSPGPRPRARRGTRATPAPAPRTPPSPAAAASTCCRTRSSPARPSTGPRPAGTHRIPSKHARFGRGVGPPRGFFAGGGRCGAILSHVSSVSSRWTTGPPCRPPPIVPPPLTPGDAESRRVVKQLLGREP